VRLICPGANLLSVRYARMHAHSCSSICPAGLSCLSVGVSKGDMSRHGTRLLCSFVGRTCIHPIQHSSISRCVQVLERLPVQWMMMNGWMPELSCSIRSIDIRPGNKYCHERCLLGPWTSESAKRKRGVLSSDDHDDGCPRQNDCFRSDAQALDERHWPFRRKTATNSNI
jgi:hypothetical protein